ILFYRNYMAQYIKENELEYRIIHFHVPIFVKLIAPAFKRNNTCKIITHSHSVAYSYNPLKKARNYLLSLGMKKHTDVFCACSIDSAKFWYGNQYFEKGKIRLIKNAIDCEKFKFNQSKRRIIRKELGIREN